MISLYFADPLSSDCQTEMAKVVQILQEILLLLLIFPGYCKLVLEAARLVIISSFQASCPLKIVYHTSYLSILIHHRII